MHHMPIAQLPRPRHRNTLHQLVGNIRSLPNHRTQNRNCLEERTPSDLRRIPPAAAFSLAFFASFWRICPMDCISDSHGAGASDTLHFWHITAFSWLSVPQAVHSAVKVPCESNGVGIMPATGTNDGSIWPSIQDDAGWR